MNTWKARRNPALRVAKGVPRFREVARVGHLRVAVDLDGEEFEDALGELGRRLDGLGGLKRRVGERNKRGFTIHRHPCAGQCG